MNKLEKSIRRELKYYGAAIRSGHYGVIGHTANMPKKGFISCVCADVENGAVSDIRMYVYGDAKLKRDFYGETVDITIPVEEYILQMISWDDMVVSIMEIVEKYLQ